MNPKRLSSSKINPTKLLGGSSFSKKTTNIGDKLKEDSISISKSDLSTIKKQVFEIKDLVTSLTTLKKKKLTTKRKETEREKFGEREKELEKKKKPEDNKIKLPEAPKLGFLDIVKRFVVNTLIGFVVVRLIKHLPKLIEVAKFVGGAMDFITNVGGKLLNGLATFVQKGYEAYDFTRKTLKSFGGENALKLFDGFNDALGGIVTAALAASFAIFDMAGGDSGGGDTTGIKGRTPGRSRRGIDPKLARKYAERYGRDAAVSRFGRDGVRSLGGKYARSGVQNLARTGLVSLAGKSGAKAVLKFVKPLVNKIPIIGGLIEFGLSWALGEPVGKAAFRGIGSVLLGGIGTAIGGPIGAFIGAAAGGEVGGALYDLFFGNKKPAEQKVAKAAGGGQPATRGGKLVGGAPKRTAPKSKAKRQISIQPTQLKPGADIGGEEKIEKVFPKSKDKNQVSPLDYIEKSYKNTNQDRFFGSLLNLQTKSLVGQKPSKVDYANAAQGLSNWMTMTFSDEILRTGAVYAAGGGEINADMLSKKSGDMTDAIAKSLEGSISKRLDANIDDLMKQMMLKKGETEKPSGTQPGDGEFLPGSVPGGQMTIEQLVGLAKGAGFDDNEAVIMAAIAMAESGGNSKSHNTKPPDNSYGLWQINMYDTLGPARLREYGLSSYDQLFDPVTNAKAAYAIRKSSGFTAWSVYKSGRYKNFLGQAQSARNAPSLRVSPITSTSGPAAMVTGGLKASQVAQTSAQGWRWGKMHKGIDMDGGDGAPISSAQNATVAHSGWLDDGYGYSVILRYNNGAETRFGHLQSTNVKTGQQIRAGQVLGKQGNTGASKGSHLHFEYYPNGRAMTYEGYGNAAAVKDSYIRYGGNIVPIIPSSPMDTIGSRFHGGFVPKDGIYNLHKNEFVVDADSVNLVGKNFIATINAIENKTQLNQRVGSLIGHLSYITGYEPGGQQEVVVEMPEPEVIPVMTPIPVGGCAVATAGSAHKPDPYQDLYRIG